jgi:hypothetical protein
MKKIAFTLLVVCLCLGAGCSRPSGQLTEAEKRQKEADAQERARAIERTAKPVQPMEENPVPEPSPSPSPKP